MKATGVVRRIDDLGRVVIPKEIRRSLRIKDGETLEIFVDSNNIVLKKFSMMKNIIEYASDIVDVLYSYLKKTIIVTDNDSIVACSNNIKKIINNKSISNQLIAYIKKREVIIEKNSRSLNILDEYTIESKYVITPIISNGDSVGLIIIYDDNDITDLDIKLSSVVSKILAKSIEE